MLKCDVEIFQYHVNALAVCLVQVALWAKGGGIGRQPISFYLSSYGVQHEKLFTVKFHFKELANIPLLT